MRKKEGKYSQHLFIVLLMLIMTCAISPVKSEAASARIKINTITNKMKKVKGTIKIPGKKHGKYRVVLKIGKHKYSKKCNSKGVYKIKLKKKYPVKTRVKITAYRKSGKKWKKCGYRYLKVKNVKKNRKKYVAQRADGLYYRKASSEIRYYYYTGSNSAHGDISIFTKEMKKKHCYPTDDPNPCYRYYYKGKWYDTYDLPYKTEVALARKSKYLKEYFKYFDYYKKTNSKAQSVLYAMFKVAYTHHWKYKITNNCDWSELFIYHHGQCQAYAETLNYLSYISGVDCLVVGGGYGSLKNHIWNIMKHDGKWYHVDVVDITRFSSTTYYPLFGDKVASAKKMNEPYNYGYGGDYKLASQNIFPTKQTLLNSKGTSKLKNAGYLYAKKDIEELKKEQKEQEEAHKLNIKIEPRNWSYNNITNGVLVGSKKMLTVNKTLYGKNLTQDYTNHKNYRSSNSEVAKIVSTQFGNTPCYYVYGVSPGTATVTADIEGTTVKWDVTVVQ